MSIQGIEHIQLAMPRGCESQAIEFYSGLLGIPEKEKPEHLLANGGAWFESASLKVHLGVDPNFVPARKAHPAFLVSGLASLATVLNEAGYDVSHHKPVEGKARCFTSDPFGNRIEFMEKT